ncbi:hypothetical protein NAT51_14560 [Flavobacterium amniphilum]|uniref:hypothetical protein n=1 Tax=Flavobacterium amniphilum TaxID=1834035 RepID=UPI00202A17C9|nr:hypothetical protein [Flavobacterium amniphilum]MCL9806753.1 hypothetical protein [Flavobacterium amniphilum]
MKTALYFIFVLLSTIGFAQYTNPVASKMGTEFIQADTYLGEDAYSFQYFTKNNVLFKKSNNVFFQYKNLSLGKITRVDLQNPLRILVFYQDFNTVLALDSQLNEIQRINFSENQSGLTASSVGLASQNNYWVFDMPTQQLYLYNYVKNTTQLVGNPFPKNIKNYSCNFNLFYWTDEDNKYYTSDIFGKKELLGTIPGYDQIFMYDERMILYKKEEKLYFFDLIQNKSIPVKEVENSFKSFYYKNQNLAIFTPEGITNYKINLP